MPFVLANLLNGLWQIPWLTRNFGLAAIVIIGILTSLTWLYIRLDPLGMVPTERWTLGVPVSLFLAWLCVATTLNITIVLVAAGWRGVAVSPPIVVFVLAGVGTAFLWRTGDVVFAAVLVWAFAAIYAANVVSLSEEPALAGALASHRGLPRSSPRCEAETAPHARIVAIRRT